jgi:hypothetical protein
MSFISDCCGATPYLGSTDYGRCSDCKENCEFEINQELEDCDVCYGQGYVHSNDQEGNDEIQRCDNCEEFDNDLEAQSFYRDMGFPEFSYEEEVFNRGKRIVDFIISASPEEEEMNNKILQAEQQCNHRES